jgi:hypothetical protein
VTRKSFCRTLHADRHPVTLRLLHQRVEDFARSPLAVVASADFVQLRMHLAVEDLLHGPSTFSHRNLIGFEVELLKEKVYVKCNRIVEWFKDCVTVASCTSAGMCGASSFFYMSPELTHIQRHSMSPSTCNLPI